jgi:hypothetical protein
MFGTDEPNAGGPAELETIRRSARSSRKVDTVMIPGGAHDYMGCEHELAEAVGNWVDGLVGEGVTREHQEVDGKPGASVELPGS